MHCQALILIGALLVVQGGEPIVAKDALSVHRVQRGTMPLRTIARGVLTSTHPPRATVSLPLASAETLRTGLSASIQIAPPAVLHGELARIERHKSTDTVTARIELSDALPSDATVGTKVNALIDVGELPDVVYFERPADARPGQESYIYVVEPDDEHARRATVRYGRQSGSLIEVVSGLSPGDRVIVTDMSAWAAYERVRLQ